jgi:NAD(P)-dependent dehydrogenase (short-subunit alcohol dehydrogenase family)
MTRSLEGRRIAVAGAGGGLGPDVVRALAAAGAWVAAGDRDADRLAPLADVAGDVRAVDLGGEVDGLVHLVGGWKGGNDIEDMPLADLELLELLLFRTVVHTTRAFAPLLKAAGPRGRFALVSSLVAQKPTKGNGAYAATKAAAEAWTLTFAKELAETEGTANVLVVNAIVTPAMREASPEKAYKTFTDTGEIADALVYVASDDARKMNGQRLALHS